MPRMIPLNPRNRGLWATILLIGFGSICILLWWQGQATVDKEDDLLYLGLIGGSATVVLSLMNYWLQRDSELRILFKEMNATYDRLNNDLDAVNDGRRTGPEAERTVVDYMNLCAEEYFWYKRGRIDGEIWRAWDSGMRSRFAQEPIAAIARKELREYHTSYYGWEKLAQEMLKPTKKKGETGMHG